MFLPILFTSGKTKLSQVFEIEERSRNAGGRGGKKLHPHFF